MKLPHILLWRDPGHRSAAENMAIDAALFRRGADLGTAVARVYGWDHRAVTFGYFGKEADQPDSAARRITGGGRVEHGEDLTLTLVFPAGTEVAKAPSTERYRWIHTALAASLDEIGAPVSLFDGNFEKSESCFAAPVPWDLLDPRSGTKIGGGAQRRSRGAVIYQGSFRLPPEFRSLDAAWIDGFVGRLAAEVEPVESARRFSLELGFPSETLGAP